MTDMTPKETVTRQIDHIETVPYSFSLDRAVGKKLDRHFGDDTWRKTLTDYIIAVPGVDQLQLENRGGRHSRDLNGGIWRVDMAAWHLDVPPLKEPSFKDFDFPDITQFFRTEDREKALAMCETSPDQMLAFVDYVSDLPVQAIFFADDWGDQKGVTLGPDRWREYLQPRWEKVYASARRALSRLATLAKSKTKYVDFAVRWAEEAATYSHPQRRSSRKHPSKTPSPSWRLLPVRGHKHRIHG